MIHGEAKKGGWTPEYVAWRSMKARCLIPSSSSFHKYGARGIRVAPEWVDDFAAFVAHVGRRPGPGYSLERKDNEGHYEPGNVRWATSKEQARNRRSSRMITHAGETMTLAAWAERAGILVTTLKQRIDRAGWPMEKALAPPLKTWSRRRRA